MASRIPISISDWNRLASDHLRDEFRNKVSIDISQIGKIGSASKVNFEDWLLLRSYWREIRSAPSHEAFFDPKTAKQLKNESYALLKKQDWWGSLIQGSSSAWDWSRMGPWKHSLQEILARDRNAAPAIAGNSIFDGSAETRVILRRNPGRAGRHQGNMREASGSERSGRSEAASVHSSTDLRPSPPGSYSPPLPVPLGAAPRLRQASDAISLGSNLSAEEKLLSQTRPDEALVNMSFILLLQGLIAPLVRTKKEFAPLDWTILHKSFTITQPDRESRSRVPILTAKTDGCMVAKPSPKSRAEDCPVLAIVEVKPFRRGYSQDAIRMQESAEMAAWISSEHKYGQLPSVAGKYRRLLLAQDLDQVSIVIAEYDDRLLEPFPRRRGKAANPTTGTSATSRAIRLSGPPRGRHRPHPAGLRPDTAVTEAVRPAKALPSAQRLLPTGESVRPGPNIVLEMIIVADLISACRIRGPGPGCMPEAPLMPCQCAPEAAAARLPPRRPRRFQSRPRDPHDPLPEDHVLPRQHLGGQSQRHLWMGSWL